MHYSGYDNRSGSNRRSFLKSGALVASAGTVGAGLLARGLPASGEEKSGPRTQRRRNSQIPGGGNHRDRTANEASATGKMYKTGFKNL